MASASQEQEVMPSHYCDGVSVSAVSKLQLIVSRNTRSGQEHTASRPGERTPAGDGEISERTQAGVGQMGMGEHG